MKSYSSLCLFNNKSTINKLEKHETYTQFIDAFLRTKCSDTTKAYITDMQFF